MINYTAYLFDMDGTLVNSEKIKGKALAETCSRFGGKVDVNIYKTVMGRNWKFVTDHFFKMAKIQPDIKDFNAEFKPIYEQLLQKELASNPNALELLIKLKSKGKRLGLVSSASRWMVDHIISQLELSNFFEVVITKENVVNHKPDPEAYLLALKKLSLPSSEVLIFEDSETGLIAARNAKCDSIAFKHEFNVNHDLSLALQRISDYNELSM